MKTEEESGSREQEKVSASVKLKLNELKEGSREGIIEAELISGNEN